MRDKSAPEDSDLKRMSRIPRKKPSLKKRVRTMAVLTVLSAGIAVAALYFGRKQESELVRRFRGSGTS